MCQKTDTTVHFSNTVEMCFFPHAFVLNVFPTHVTFINLWKSNSLFFCSVCVCVVVLVMTVREFLLLLNNGSYQVAFYEWHN